MIKDNTSRSGLKPALKPANLRKFVCICTFSLQYNKEKPPLWKFLFSLRFNLTWKSHYWLNCHSKASWLRSEDVWLMSVQLFLSNSLCQFLETFSDNLTQTHIFSSFSTFPPLKTEEKLSEVVRLKNTSSRSHRDTSLLWGFFFLFHADAAIWQRKMSRTTPGCHHQPYWTTNWSQSRALTDAPFHSLPAANTLNKKGEKWIGSL